MLQDVDQLSQQVHVGQLHKARPQQVVQQLTQRLQQRPQRLSERRGQRRCRGATDTSQQNEAEWEL